MDEVVHAPLMGFVGFFTIYVDKTRDVGKGGFWRGKEVFRVGVLKQFHYKENRGYLI
jgi:hypothetical protein